MPPLISAIVLNYRSPQYAVKCVHALLAQSIAKDMEILVVDNHSQDDSIGILRNRLKDVPSVKILENRENTGYGQGNELGIAHAKGEYLLILNPDNVLAPTATELMLDTLKKDDGVGIVAPQLIHDDGTIRPSFRAFPRLLDVIAKRTFLAKWMPKRVNRYMQADADPHAARDVDWVVGACFMMRTDFYKKLGGFDPRFFLFFEDIDLCRRCSDAGKRVVYLPAAKASDRKRRLSDGSMFSLMLSPVGRAHLMSGIRYFAKWGLFS